MWMKATKKNMAVETVCRDQEAILLLPVVVFDRSRTNSGAFLVLVLLFLCVSCSLGFRNR